MTMTLEQIKGMNIPVGTPIEITLNSNSEPYKTLGYYHGLKQRKTVQILLYDTNTANDKNWKASIYNEFLVSSIKEIRILEHKK
jgi:hypothetical protein